jgi:hypothetical protein
MVTLGEMTAPFLRAPRKIVPSPELCESDA